MSAGALLSYYTTPAERLRGAVFAEGFESYNRVIQNGAVFSGAPLPSIDTTNKCATFGAAPSTGQLTYLPMAGPLYMTVSLWFRTTTVGTAERILICHGGWGAASTWRVSLMNTGTGRLRVYMTDNAGNVLAAYTSGDLGYADNNWHHVGVSVNRPTRAFAITYDGTSLAPAALGIASSSTFVPFNIVVGGSIIGGGLNFHDGSIRDVKIFNQDLTVAELQQIAAKSVYSYRRRAVMHCPMGIAQHDPANARTLDVSGNGYHLNFRAGNAPTKDPAQRGYLFSVAGTNGMTSVARPVQTTGARTLFQVMGSTTAAYSGVSRCAGLLQADAATLGIGFSVFVLTGIVGVAWEAGTASLDNTTTRGGDILYTAAFPGGGAAGYSVQNTAPLFSVADRRTSDDDRYVVVGRTNGGAWGSVNSLVRCIMLWEEQLTPLQIYDLHALYLQQKNRV